MDRLYQNIVIFIYVFSCNNPNGIFRYNSKTWEIFVFVLVILIILMILTIIYFFVIGLGFLTSYVVNHQSYDILSGCPLNEPNCPYSQIVCNGRSYGDIFGNCIFTGLLSLFILSLSAIIIIPILYCIIKGISTIIDEIYLSFKNTRENITIPILSEKIIVDINHDDVIDINNDIKLDDIKLDDIKLDDIKLDDL